jgi:hypothetical protein
MQPRQKFFSCYENFVVTASGNKLEKIAMSLIISAFHPKALNVVCETGRSSGSTRTYQPSRFYTVAKRISLISNLVRLDGFYSYGDSAGFTPVFPFNSLREAEKPITKAKLSN